MAAQIERTRDEDIAGWMEALWRNLRHAVRTLARAPGFTTTAVLTLALGIGANSAVFSAIDAVLLRPLPFPDADRLVRMSQTQERSSETNIAPVRLEDWNQLSSTFEAMTGYFAEDVSETSGDLPEGVRRAWVAPRFLDVWGMRPVLGRSFTAADHQEGAPAIVVIGDRYWRNRLGADPDVLRRTVRIGDQSFSIVGVTAASFRFPDRDVDLWFPRIYDRFTQSRLATWYIGIGRLKPGVTLEQARADLGVVQAQLAEQYPDTDREIGVQMVPLKETLVGGVRGSLWLLYGAVSVLLLIACTNIAALLLSRAAHRQREIAVRLSLGASRAAVTAQMVTETAVLALGGAVAGLSIAAAAARALRALAPDFPRIDEIALDGRILLYSLVLMTTVTVLCGLVPAIRSSRGRLAGAVAEAGRAHVSSYHSLQWLLVGAQVALSVTLLAGAGLLFRSFQELSRVDLGFEPRRVLTFRVSWQWAETVNMARLRQETDRVLDGLLTLPGVEAAATSVTPPGVPGAYEQEFELIEGRAGTEPRMLGESRVVSPSYFATMRVPVLAGELCRQQPAGARWGEVMVNRRFVEQYLPGSSAIGLHFASPPGISIPPRRIVGIVGDARERGIDRDHAPTVYHCSHPQQPFRVFLVRTRGNPVAIVQAVRLKIKELEPLRSVYDVAPLEEWIGDAFAQNWLRAVLLAFFALTAISLACVGLYGTLSYVVSLRRREVGLRLALGALRRDIVVQYLLKSLRVVGLACLAGVALSVASSRLLSGMLYGVSPYDPATLFFVIFLVAVVATLASVLPATRAALVEPVHVLREE